MGAAGGIRRALTGGVKRIALLLALVVAGCSTATPEPKAEAKASRKPVPVTIAVTTHAPLPVEDREDSADAIDEQISAGTMFCVETRETDCPGGFSCVDGECVAATATD